MIEVTRINVEQPAPAGAAALWHLCVLSEILQSTLSRNPPPLTNTITVTTHYPFIEQRPSLDAFTCHRQLYSYYTLNIFTHTTLYTNLTKVQYRLGAHS